jgi:23S rRNA pseudouridine2605 synthase/16S rRNA pseudouridine516 synthase
VERLHKVLARAGVASRRASERLIAEGKVTVNGRTIREMGHQVDPSRDAIKVDGRRILLEPRAPTYLMLHKPRGYVTTLRDPEGRPTVADLVRVPARVFPVGRLDYASEGLLLLTDDGDLAAALMHPRRGVEKTYAVKVRGTPAPDAVARLAAGSVRVHGRPAEPASVKVVRPGANGWIEVTVTEGRKHLVRLLLEAVGHPVLRLRRIRYGGVALGKLPPGGWRRLTRPEVTRLELAAGRGTPPRRRGQRSP